MRKSGRILFFVVFMVLLGVINYATPVRANIASGVYDGVNWRIEDDGVLVIGNGGTQTMTYRSAREDRSYPWYYYGSRITEVRIDGTVVANGSLAFMFGTYTYTPILYPLLTKIDLTGLNTTNVTSAYAMFDHCYNLTELNVSSLDTRNMTTMWAMFWACQSLTTLDVSNFNTSKVTDFQGMFGYCSNLETIDVTGFDTSSAVDIGAMFHGCSSLKEIDVTGFDTSKVINGAYQPTVDPHGIFQNCESLESLDLSSWDMTKMNNMMLMFAGCKSLRKINLGSSFTFKGNNIRNVAYQAILPTPDKHGYTGKWVRDDETYGPYEATTLRDNYTSNMAGTWIWDERKTGYDIQYVASGGASGSMVSLHGYADLDEVLAACSFVKPGCHFEHWMDDEGRIYEDCAVIPADTYHAGDMVTLTAVFVQDVHDVSMQEGVLWLELHGFESVTFDAIPANTMYQVYEETSDGWVLLESDGSTGSLMSAFESNAKFFNKYMPGTTSVQFVGVKTLDGTEVDAGRFTFALLEDGQVVFTTTNFENGFIQFPSITYTSAGEHDYVIREIDSAEHAIDYDAHEEHIHVSVIDNGEGTLTRTVTYDNDGIRFENHMKPGVLEIKKSILGYFETVSDDSFIFEIMFDS